ncbi:hypothetical protein F5Y10DRAFT_290866 [Nemania abortiva]|nr:hypothetical protein F5Y10DRAFT_290866 [Nemania abortiva]
MVVTTVHSVIAWEPESEADLRFFQTIPWCAEIINQHGVKPYRGDFPRRHERGMDPVIHGFMFRDGGVLKSGSFLAEPGVLRVHHPHSRRIAGTVSGDPVTASSHQEPPLPLIASKSDYPVHIDVFTLDEGLTGFSKTIYGGVIALLADGVCGKVAFMHRDPTNQLYTVYTNTRFVKPMIVDQDGTITIVVKTQICSLQTSEGKILAIASFEGPGGIVYATAESMCREGIWKGRL